MIAENEKLRSSAALLINDVVKDLSHDMVLENPVYLKHKIRD
jgi:hypothetical protein